MIGELTELELDGLTNGPAAGDVASRLRTVIGRLSRRLRPTVAGGGLTPTQISVLFTLARAGSMRLAELADAEGINPTMLSRIVAGLGDAGLARRQADPGDRRAAIVHITANGRRLRDRIQRERAAVLGAQLAQLDADEVNALIAALPALEALAERLRGRRG